MGRQTWAAALGEVRSFGNRLKIALWQAGMLERCLLLQMDHACYRVSTSETADALKRTAKTFGTVISSAEIHGREIVIVQTHEPVVVSHWETNGVELPFPKPGQAYEDGWEHVEFVLPEAGYTIDGLRFAFAAHFKGAVDFATLMEYEYTESTSSAIADQLPNPTISLTLSHRLRVKFHARPIQEVVGHQLAS